MLVLFAVTALAGIGAWLSLTPDGAGSSVDPRKVPVATVLYQWYGYAHERENDWPSVGGLGSFHWNDVIGNELITGFVANRPEIGYYASDDETIAWQLREMEEAGIDTIIVSWWGWGDVDLYGDVDEQTEGYIEQRSHDALINLLDQIKSKGLNFKVAIMVEPWPDVATPTRDYERPPNAAFNLTDGQKQVIFDYLADNVYDVYPDQMFEWDGKPLLIAVPRMFFDPGADNRFTLRSLGFRHEDNDPGNAWDWIITEPLPYLQDVQVGDRDETVAILIPKLKPR